MAKIVIAGDSIVVTSSKTLEAIKTLEKAHPKALCLYEQNEDGKNEEIFRVASTTGQGSINCYGASFGSVTHDDAKLATITMQIPAGTQDAVAYAADRIGCAITLLEKVEAQFDAAIEEVAAEKAAVLAKITVV